MQRLRQRNDTLDVSEEKHIEVARRQRFLAQLINQAVGSQQQNNAEQDLRMVVVDGSDSSVENASVAGMSSVDETKEQELQPAGMEGSDREKLSVSEETQEPDLQPPVRDESDRSVENTSAEMP